MQENLFIPVPKTTIPGGIIVPPFHVGQYICTQQDGKAAVTADGAPWLVNTFDEARKACEAAGFKLLTDRQFAALCTNIGKQSINWTLKAGKQVLFFERGWLQLSNGKRIFGLCTDLWVAPSKDSPVPLRENSDSAIPHGFFCTR